MVGEVVAGDARGEFAVAFAAADVQAVQGVDGIDAFALHLAGAHGARGEVEDGIAGGTQDGALIGGRHVAAGPVGRAGDRAAARIEHHNERRQVFVGGAKAVGDPCAQRRVPLQDAAGIHLDIGRAVGERVHVERLDHRHLVHVLRQVGEGVGAPEAGLAAPLEFPHGAEDFSFRIARRRISMSMVLPWFLTSSGL